MIQHKSPESQDSHWEEYRQETERILRSRSLWKFEGKRKGLVKSSISDRKPERWVLTVYRGYTKLKRTMAAQPPQLVDARRGVVVGFSRRSRKRLIEKTLAWDTNFKSAYFVTLTYPGSYSSDSRTWKNDLAKFAKRLRRRFPGISGFWRLEFQRRGAPHFHLLLDNVPVPWMEFTRFVTLAWGDIAHRGDIHEGRYATNVRPCDTRRKAVRYVSKYMGKQDDNRFVDQESGEIVALDKLLAGRVWGKIGQINAHMIAEVSLSNKAADLWRAAAIDWLTRQNSLYAEILREAPKHVGFSLYGVGYPKGGEETQFYRSLFNYETFVPPS